MSGSYNRRQGFEISYTTTEQCGTDEFVCLSDGQCQPPDARCNGETDCQDGSDEDGIMCGEHIIFLKISIDQYKYHHLLLQVVEILTMLHQMGSCTQFLFRTHIPPKWSVSTSFRKGPGPTSKRSSSSST